MKKFRIILGLIFVLTFLSANVYAVEPWVPMMDKLDEIYEIVLDTNDKITPIPCEGSPVAKTGQTISYEPGDDGDLQKGMTPPVPRFTDNLDGTVTDNLTGLEWTKDGNLYQTISWYQALLNANNCNIGNYTDWRLPNIKELRSLLDFGNLAPALSNNHPFINVKPGRLDFYWSSTSGPDTLYYNAFTVGFNFGYTSLADKNNNINPLHIWCVRGRE